MSEEEIERAKWEAEVYGAQDKQNEEFCNSRIEAENTLRRAEGEYSQNKRSGISLRKGCQGGYECHKEAYLKDKARKDGCPVSGSA